MSTETEIVNLALSKLGKQPIASLDEESDQAELASRTLYQIMDAVLQAHNWNFAIMRASLPANAEGPVWGYQYSYNLPSSPNSCLRVLSVNGEHVEAGAWKVEGRKVLTDFESPIEIQYVAQSRDTGDFSPLFVEALATRLAAEWAIHITGKRTTQEALFITYREKIAEARSVDGSEGTPDQLDDGSWVEAFQLA